MSKHPSDRVSRVTLGLALAASPSLSARSKPPREARADAVIQIDQTEHDRSRGVPPWEAIVESAVRRVRLK